jgi:hypothetical protein
MKRFRWNDLALLPFMLCVWFLRLLGKLFGLTYKQISVVFNLWVQGAVLLLSGLALAAVAIYKCAISDSYMWYAVAIPLTAYAILHVYGFIKMLHHYHLPFDDAFNLCVEDLVKLAAKWHTTYQIVNLIIFVLFFLIIIGVNIYATYNIVNY